jgi:4-amino-4-deoxy-L-arabinose transferase-like glycosyltransferase
MREKYLSNYDLLFWVVLSLITFYRLIFIAYSPLDLSPDEAYYWDWSRRPAFGYFSKPPMVAWIIAMFSNLGGSTVFFVRMGAVVLAAASGVVLFQLGKEMFSSRVGFWAFLASSFNPGSSAASVLMTIDPPLIFFWGLTTLFVHRAISRGSLLYWILGGVGLGFGLLSKYTMLLLVPSVALYLIASPDRRRLILTPGPYLFCLVGFLLLLPNLYWNHQNGWIAFHHTSGYVQSRPSGLTRLNTFLEFFGLQFGLISPVTFFLLLATIALMTKKGRFLRGDHLAYLFWVTLPTLGGITLLSLFMRCLPNWGAPAYFSGLLLVAAAILHPGAERLWNRRPEKVFFWGVVVGLFFAAVTFHLDNLMNLFPKVPPRRDPLVRVRGWSPLGREVSLLAQQMGGTKKVFVMSNVRQIVCEMAFYAEGQPRTYRWNVGGGVYSQYGIWKGLNERIGQDAVFVTKITKDIPADLKRFFTSVEQQRILMIPIRKGSFKKFKISICRGFQGIPE